MPSPPLLSPPRQVCWGTYKSTEDGSNVKMWGPCVVKRVADGETDKGRDGEYFTARARLSGSNDWSARMRYVLPRTMF